MAQRVVGALGGWKRRPAAHGVLLTLQVAPSAEAFRTSAFDLVELALNDRQLRSLARDLTRAAGERGLKLFSRKPLWRRMLDAIG